MAELGDAGEQDEADVVVHGFEDTVEGLQDVPVLLLQVGVVDGVEQGLVVLVHEDHRLPPRLFVCGLYQIDKTFLHGLVLFLVPVQGLVFFEVSVYDVVQRLGVLIVFGVEVNV